MSVNFSNQNDLRRCAPEYRGTRVEQIKSDLIVPQSAGRQGGATSPAVHSSSISTGKPYSQTEKVSLAVDVRDLDDLFEEFGHFSDDLILRIWDEQREEYEACRTILRSLPYDFESDPEWLRDLRAAHEQQENSRSADGGSSEAKDSSRQTYRDVAEAAAIKAEQAASQTPPPPPRDRLLEQRVWQPQIMVVKNPKHVVAAETTSSTWTAEDEEDEQELQWLICCDGSRDAAKIVGSSRRKAASAGLHVRLREHDQRLKRMATAMK